MVKVNASTLGHLTTSSKALDRILALEAEVSRLRHHVSVLSKRLKKYESAGRVLFTREKPKFFPGKGEDKLRSFWVGKAVDEEEEKEEVAEEVRRVEEVAESEAEVAEEVATVEAEKEAEVVAVDLESVAGGSVAEPKVWLPEVVVEGSKKRGVGEVTEEEKEVREVRELIVPLGPRAEYGGLLRRIGKELVFKDADPSFVAGGGSTPAAVAVSRRSEAWRQSPGASGGYQLRPRVGGFRGRGYGGYGRGRGV